jgi:hypothetical protein
MKSQGKRKSKKESTLSDSEEFIVENTTEEESNAFNDSDSFQVTFREGSIFKSLLEYLKLTTKKGNFNFSKSGISYSKLDKNKKILNILRITCDLLQYEFNSDNEEIIYGINFNDLITVIGKIRKTDGIRLSKFPNDNKLYVGITESKKTISVKNVGHITPYDEQDIQWDFDEEENEVENSIVISSEEFIDACSRITSSKSDVSMSWMGKGILFETTIGTVTKTSPLGDIDYHDKKSCEIIINSNIIKNLSKLGNLYADGTLRITLQKNRPLKIMTGISNYGVLKSYTFDDDLLKKIIEL